VSEKKESTGFFAGLLYGLIPHIGCIALILFATLGVTTAAAFLKPLMLSSFFFYLLVALSIVFATLSAALYLRRTGMLSLSGIRKKRKYLSILYGTTISVNLFLLFVVFPFAANAASEQGSQQIKASSTSTILLRVDIPCPGHAPLISEELYKVRGVTQVEYLSPNFFRVTYGTATTSQEEILSSDIFNTYGATVVAGQQNFRTGDFA